MEISAAAALPDPADRWVRSAYSDEILHQRIDEPKTRIDRISSVKFQIAPLPRKGSLVLSVDPKKVEFANAYLPYVYTVEEVSALLRVKPATVYAEIRAGRLIARRVGKEYRVHPDRLDEYATCQDQENPRGSGSGTTRKETERRAPRIFNGSFSMMASKSEQDVAAMSAENLLKKLSPGTSRRS